jgi:O-antigen ligase
VLLATVTPSAFVLLVLAVRRAIAPIPTLRTTIPVAAWVLVGFTTWLAVSAWLSAHRPVTVGWFLSFCTLVVLPALLAMSDPDARRIVQGTWILLAAVLGAYALVETFLLQANPLYDRFYSAAGGGIEQVWSVYRATTSLGHPLHNGVFFAVAVPLALGRVLATRSRAAVLATMLAMGGLVSSASRGALVAALLGAVLLLVHPARQLLGRRPGGVVRLVGLSAVAVVLTVGVAYVALRSQSVEAGQSLAFRSTEVPVAVQAVERSPLLGVGPGAASLSHQSVLEGGGAGAFESFWLELVVGAGVPGLLLGIAVLATALAAALRGGAPDVAAALVSYVAAVSAFNALEGGRPELLELGLLMALAFSALSRRRGAWVPAPAEPNGRAFGTADPAGVSLRA